MPVLLHLEGYETQVIKLIVKKEIEKMRALNKIYMEPDQYLMDLLSIQKKLDYGLVRSVLNKDHDSPDVLIIADEVGQDEDSRFRRSSTPWDNPDYMT